MKYILNEGRYAIAFPIEKNGREVKITLDRKRVYLDTGNIATNGITEVEDEDYKKLCEIKRFNAMIKAGELSLTEASKVETAETKVADLEKENAELKAQLNANPKAKELKEKDEEIANLKAKLEALSKGAEADADADTKADESF